MQAGWTREVIAGKSVALFHPPVTAAPRFAVLYLHPIGMESLAENAVYTHELGQLGLVCCAPEGMRSWWTDRICPEFDPQVSAERHLLENVIPWIRQQYSPGLAGLAVAGISMGGQGALRLGFKYPDRFPVVAGIASALDYQILYGQGTPLDEMYPSAEHCRQDTAVLQIDPHRYPPAIWFACDPDDVDWSRGNDRLHEKLSALGIPHTTDLETRAGGHSWDYFNAMARPMFRFITEALSKQSRRLV